MTPSRPRHYSEQRLDSSNSWFLDPEALTNAIRTHLGRVNGLDQIPGIELRELISTGGQSRVFSGMEIMTGRPIAVKVVLDGVFTGEDARRRFKREVEIVTELQHDRIVSALSFGETQSRLPYLVMPFIEGIRLDQWCNRERANGDTRKIVSLFAEICDAIGFAHQNGIIHRDLKPSNILIDNCDVPHILDFGLAKFTSQHPSLNTADRSITTEGQFVGSIPWTSPEQLSGDAGAVDTRTDVYAVGVMLYEALTGQFPYVVEGSLPLIVDHVLNVVPETPSKLDPSLSKSLDAIILKALAKTPEHRYSMVSELSRDLLNSLSGAPVLAMRERSRARLQRHVARYKAIAVVASVLLAAMGFLVAQSNRDRQRAEVESAKAMASAEFLQNLLAEVDPRASGVDVSVADVLDDAAAKIPEHFKDQPEVEATLEFTLGRAFGNIGRYEDSHIHLQRAWDKRKKLLGENHLDTLDVALHLATSAFVPFTSESYDLLQHVVIERREQLGPNHRDTLSAEIYLILMNMGDLDQRADMKGKIADVCSRANSILAIDDRLLHRIQLAQARSELLFGSANRAEMICREMLETFDLIPISDPEYEFRLGAKYNLAHALFYLEQFDEALELVDSSIVGMASALGQNHPAIRKEKILRGRLLVALGHLRDAEDQLLLIRRSDEASRILNDTCDFNFAAASVELQLAQGAPGAALHWLNDWMANCNRQHPFKPISHYRLDCLIVYSLADAGEYERAIAKAEDLVRNIDTVSVSHHDELSLIITLLECYLLIGDFDNASTYLNDHREMIEDGLSRQHSLYQRYIAAVRVVSQAPSNR